MVLGSALVPGFGIVTHSARMNASGSSIMDSTMGSLDLGPTSGPVGIQVQIMGQATTGITNYDQSCSISSPTNPAIVNDADSSQGAACVINGDGSTSGNFTGSFTVGNVSPGEYVIEITACPGNDGCAPSEGDFVQAIFTVQASPTIEVSPYGVYPGGTVQVFGSGFSLNDNSCMMAGDAVGSVISCQISNGQLTALFAVANVPSGYYALTVTGNTGDYANSNVGVSGV